MNDPSKVKFAESQAQLSPKTVPPQLLPHPPTSGTRLLSHTPNDVAEHSGLIFQDSLEFDQPPGARPIGEAAGGTGAGGAADSSQSESEGGRGDRPSSSVLLHNAAMDAVTEANLGDLEELSNDIDGSSVYAIRGDALKRWSDKILFAIGMIRDALAKKGSQVAPPNQSTRHLIQAQTLARSMRKMKSGGGGGSDNEGARGLSSLAAAGKTAEKGEKGSTSGIVSTIGGSVASAVYVMMEACAIGVSADWASCFIYQSRTEELVLACGVGKRLGKAGSQRIPANVGVESHVLNTGIGVNISHAYVEEEFSANMDRQTNTRTKTQIVFPLLKPGTSSVAFGVIEFGNKSNGKGLFNPEDEAKVSQCAQLVSIIISKYPSDITNGNCFDPAIFPTHHQQQQASSVNGGASILQGLNIPQGPLEPTLVHRTSRVGHLKRSEVMRDSVGLSSAPTITEAISYVTKINECWKHSVVLNMELEQEIDRLQEALRVSRRETSRLQNQMQELKVQNESLTAATVTSIPDPEKLLVASHKLPRANSSAGMLGLKASAVASPTVVKTNK